MLHVEESSPVARMFNLSSSATFTAPVPQATLPGPSHSGTPASVSSNPVPRATPARLPCMGLPIPPNRSMLMAIARQIPYVGQPHSTAQSCNRMNDWDHRRISVGLREQYATSKLTSRHNCQSVPVREGSRAESLALAAGCVPA